MKIWTNKKETVDMSVPKRFIDSGIDLNYNPHASGVIAIDFMPFEDYRNKVKKFLARNNEEVFSNIDFRPETFMTSVEVMEKVFNMKPIYTKIRFLYKVIDYVSCDIDENEFDTIEVKHDNGYSMFYRVRKQ